MKYLILIMLLSSCVSVDKRRNKSLRTKDSVLTEYIKKNESNKIYK